MNLEGNKRGSKLGKRGIYTRISKFKGQVGNWHKSTHTRSYESLQTRKRKVTVPQSKLIPGREKWNIFALKLHHSSPNQIMSLCIVWPAWNFALTFILLAKMLLLISKGFLKLKVLVYDHTLPFSSRVFFFFFLMLSFLHGHIRIVSPAVLLKCQKILSLVD